MSAQPFRAYSGAARLFPINNWRTLKIHSSQVILTKMQGVTFLLWALSIVNATARWAPKPEVTWDYHLKSALKTPVKGIEVYDIDLFDNSKTSIAKFKDEGIKVVCYFSAGSYENWRPDKNKFKLSDLGKPLDGWEGEKWLDLNSDNVRSIMKARMDMAVDKKCDGIDPDNIDGYDNKNGLGLTKKDSINYVKFLAKEAHKRGLAVSLKSGGAIVNDVVGDVDFCVQEECVEYDECDLYQPFIKANKAVFHVEYPKGETLNNKNVSAAKVKEICNNKNAKKFSTIIKNMNLDDWIQKCPKN